MKMMTNKKRLKRRSLACLLAAGVLALLGFASCSSPKKVEKVVIDETGQSFKDSIGLIRVMYGVPPRRYLEEL